MQSDVSYSFTIESRGFSSYGTHMKTLPLLLCVTLLLAGCATNTGLDNEASDPSALPKTMTLEVSKGLTMKLVLIPAGTFMMGSKLSPAECVKKYGAEEKYYDLEHPRHKVTITKPFYMGVYEVTQPQYVAVMGPGPWIVGQKPKMLTKIGPKFPASWVHWHEATEFCKRLSKTLGKTITLPTEAQWEYACRAGSTTEFYFGNDPAKLRDYCWFVENQDGKDGERYGTREGGLKKPNAWGLYDMHGNVWEWCRDWYDKDFYASGNNVDPVNTKVAKCATVRGGSWYNPACSMRSAGRNNWYKPDYRHYNVGFRVVVQP